MTYTPVDTVAETPSTPVEAPTPETPATQVPAEPSSDAPADTVSAIDVLDGMSADELTAVINEAMRPRPTEPVSFPVETAKETVHKEDAPIDL